MARSIVALLLAALAAGCASLGDPNVEYSPTLIDGTALFQTPVAPAEPIDILGVSSPMASFVEHNVTASNLGYTRFRQLMRALVRGDYFVNHYQADGTYSARETFAKGQGNCLGYTSMFIALAREAGLTAHYQLVESQPMWEVNSGYLIRNNHINVVVDGLAMPGGYKTELVVDFNLVRPDADMASFSIVSDDFALALFHANVAVDHLYRGETEQSFAHLKRAILTDPSNKIAWNNLAVIYSRNQRPDLAEQAYAIAMQIDPRDETAWAGMVVALHAQGKFEEAKPFERRVERYQRRNPFFHYALAQAALEEESYEEALAAIDEAIDLRRKDARFFELRATAAEAVGDLALAESSSRMAERYAADETQTSGSPYTRTRNSAGASRWQQIRDQRRSISR